MRTPFSWLTDPLRPLALSILGTSLLAPLPVFAADKSSADARPAEEMLATRTSALAPARVVDLGRSTPAEDGPSRGIAPVSHGRYALTTSEGLTFHRTDRPVRGLRTIDVSGSSLQLYTWDEQQADGTQKSHYAFSRGGLLPVGRVQETTYQVRLQESQFDPLRTPEPLRTGILSADAGNQLHLVQFLAAPMPEFREAIEAAGGKVLRFLTDHTYLVEMNRDVKSRVAQLGYVRWIGDYHPEYRLERELRDSLMGVAPRLPETQRYSIMLGEGGRGRQDAVARLVERVGGKVALIEDGGLRVEATLTQEQLQQVVRANEVQFIDRWGGPGETDMNAVRELGGANHLETLKGWTGQGVRGEIFDTELLPTHQEWPHTPIIHSTGTTGGLHGTSVYSNIFGRGTVANARGMIPSGQGIFFRYNESSQFGGAISRYTINQELTDPNGPYRAVFQTSSVGSALTTSYTTISAEVDDYLFKHPILSTQSQSNAGSRSSRPQAWAKNIVSVGAFYHNDTVSRTDDVWSFSGSIGPAADGRIKPDLSYFYDMIHSATGSGNANYTEFGGTSSATPQTAGHFGLLFQMWHNGVWSGHGGGADVFASRPQMATAKALMINMAHRYNWLAGGSNADIDRNKQGWGTSDVKRLLDRASVTSIINETDVLAPLGVKGYNVSVAAGQTELNVTMVYTDPMGTVGAAQARINDLSLRVTSPSGVVYWGNNGLTAGNTSTSGGVSNKVDTVENVFLANPQAGIWRVDVFADELVQDARLETPGVVDADYGLVVSGGRIIAGDPEMTLPSYGSTFTSPTLTRGLWFTSPTQFTITGLQVPNEAGHALQNIEVVRFNPGVTPPTFASTTNAFTSLFRAAGVSSGQIISVKIPVFAGDVIGILGATGDATNMYNSYSTGNSGTYVTHINGQPVTLNRLGMQYNLASNTARELFNSSGAISRVRMLYTTNNQVPAPPFSSTFSGATFTRGLWFTAPTSFILTGVQVPNEAGHALQNVQVVRFSPGVTPPAYSTTTDSFTSLFRSVGQPSGQVLRTFVQVNAGDVIGVLGATGDATMMHNSYSSSISGTFNGHIFGQPVTLYRLGMQFNLASTSATQLWTEAAGSISRVSLFYTRVGALRGEERTASLTLH
ncbi:S8 family serine peptidase [Pyxidicoccus xibeiensis]|uniref:S8 family serine peptidase n=1 Tax=Pyxidicoccus xibeiensis TaxID=2906759 RepID=UPI0020A7FCAD|nr:S8 family serine peptidase [Pyxidicoccus xibeiensis]MCP3141034.1 S8 family serine peptidase [Pyxidicoccus xibeiensis]